MGLLHGIPIAIKDSINTRDMATSAGTRLLADFRPKQDATILSPIKAAGAILFGKNNLVEMSYGLTGAGTHIMARPETPMMKNGSLADHRARWGRIRGGEVGTRGFRR